jgi:hypothetical protein
MSKFILALALCASALTAPAAESPEPRTAAKAAAVGGEMVKTVAAGGEMVRAAATRAAPAAPRGASKETQKPQPAPEPSPEVSWDMVLAAVALMMAIALRRLGSRRR